MRVVIGQESVQVGMWSRLMYLINPFFDSCFFIKVTKNEKISSPVCLLSVKNRLIFFDIGHFDQKVKNENCMNLTIIMKYLQKSCSCDM